MISEDAELHRAQRAFRSVLDAFARPGTIGRVEPAPDNPARPAALGGALEAAVRLFVDQAVSFAVADTEADEMASYLVSETHARRLPVPDADFVVVPARADARTAFQAVREACPGTLASPEKGAFLLVGCAQLAEGGTQAALREVELSGPGVRGTRRFSVDRVEWLAARDARADEFPCGVEILLVDGEGRVAAVPRSSQARLVQAGVDTSAQAGAVGLTGEVR
ncbi:phosphonate C-P lyase system protein PhnH [Rubneribacter sp.]